MLYIVLGVLAAYVAARIIYHVAHQRGRRFQKECQRTAMGGYSVWIMQHGRFIGTAGLHYSERMARHWAKRFENCMRRWHRPKYHADDLKGYDVVVFRNVDLTNGGHWNVSQYIPEPAKVVHLLLDGKRWLWEPQPESHDEVDDCDPGDDPEGGSQDDHEDDDDIIDAEFWEAGEQLQLPPAPDDDAFDDEPTLIH